MKRTFSSLPPGNFRIFSASLVSLLMLTVPMAPMVASVNRIAAARAEQRAERRLSNSAKKQLAPQEARERALFINPLPPPPPVAPVIAATLHDDIVDTTPVSGRADPGSTVTYYRFYSAALGRKPGLAEFAPDMARVSGFLDATQLEAAKTQFANDYVNRPAFASQYGTLTNAQYVDALSQTAGVTLSNRQALVALLEAGTLTRAQALRQIGESGEVYAKYYNQAFVVMEYFGYLRRDPDILYLNWIDVLNQGGDSRHMVEGFVDATEYRNRFKQ